MAQTTYTEKKVGLRDSKQDKGVSNVNLWSVTLNSNFANKADPDKNIFY